MTYPTMQTKPKNRDGTVNSDMDPSEWIDSDGDSVGDNRRFSRRSY